MVSHGTGDQPDKAPPAHKPLRRNRDFILMMTGQLLSGWGSELTLVAYPLLVLAITNSPAKAGFVSFSQLAASPLFALAAGVVADRVDRRSVMIAADSVSALAVGSLAAVIILQPGLFWPIPVLAMVEGIGSVFFRAAQTGAIRSVVPPGQLADAVGIQQARSATASVAGPPVGGALFGITRSLPFLADAASYVFSFVSLMAVRTPFQEKRDGERSSILSQLREGISYMWQKPFLRTSAFLYSVGNFTLPGVLLVVVVRAKDGGLSGAEIGALFSVFSGFIILGSVASPYFRKTFSMRTIILIELWVSLGSVCFLIWPNAYVLMASLLPLAMAMPITDSVVVSYRISIVPDRLVGRVESVRTTIAQSVYPLGPLVAGILLTHISVRWTVAVFTAASLGVAVWGTASRAVRDVPHLKDAQAGARAAALPGPGV